MSSDATKIQSNVSAFAEKNAERSIAGANAQWQQTRAVDAPYVTIDGANHMLLKPGQLWLGSSGKGVEVNYAATIHIQVRELQGQYLGLLNLPPDDKSALERVKAQAMSRKLSEDTQWHGIDHQSARDPQKNAYFGSPPHVVWSEAASLRSGGRLDAEWMRNFDPYGGTSASGPSIAPDDMYPSDASKIGMAHKTDWNLGRFFNAGPLESLYDSGVSQPHLGLYGLTYRSPVEPAPRDLYTIDGHPDWRVEYAKNPMLMRSETEVVGNIQTVSLPGIGDGNFVRASFDDFRHAKRSIRDGDTASAFDDDTIVDTIHRRHFNLDSVDHSAPQNPYADRFAALMKSMESQNLGIDKQKDNAAALLEAIIAAKFKPDQDVQVLIGTKGNLIAMQGFGDGTNRVSVEIDTTTGAFDRLSRALSPPSVTPTNSNNLTAQIAHPKQADMQPEHEVPTKSQIV